jgi:hypothetical protein
MDVGAMAYIKALLKQKPSPNYPNGLGSVLDEYNRAMNPNYNSQESAINAMKENNFMQYYGRPQNQKLGI